jgi:ATP-binding cassette subfamily F protein 3
MLVSHDRALLRETCDEFWLVTRGGVQPFDGDLDDYQKWLLEVSRATARGAEPPPAPRSTSAPAPAPTTSLEPTRSDHGKAPGVAPKTAAAPADRRDDRKQAAQSRSVLANRTRPLRMEVQQIDGRLEKLAAEKAAIETLLSAGKRPPGEIAEAGRRLNHIAAEVAMLEERWLALHSEIEALQMAG